MYAENNSDLRVIGYVARRAATEMDEKSAACRRYHGVSRFDAVLRIDCASM
jgi:hypothetical protein